MKGIDGGINIQIPSPAEAASCLAPLPLDEQFREREIVRIKKQKIRPGYRRTNRGYLFRTVDGNHIGLGSFDEFHQAVLTIGHEIGHTYFEGDSLRLDWHTKEWWCERFAEEWHESLPEKTLGHIYLLCERLKVLREVEDMPLFVSEELWEGERVVNKILHSGGAR